MERQRDPPQTTFCIGRFSTHNPLSPKDAPLLPRHHLAMDVLHWRRLWCSRPLYFACGPLDEAKPYRSHIIHVCDQSVLTFTHVVSSLDFVWDAHHQHASPLCHGSIDFRIRITLNFFWDKKHFYFIVQNHTRTPGQLSKVHIIPEFNISDLLWHRLGIHLVRVRSPT